MTTTETKELPIRFIGPEVRAILDGRQTQARLVLKPQPSAGSVFEESLGVWRDTMTNPGKRWTCPYGAPGDRLWVRETWATNDDNPIMDDDDIVYRATDGGWDSCEGFRWRPSIYMPRWASRITLEITDVRVERLQEISEADAKAEGVGPSTRVELANGDPCYTVPFQALWRSLHGIDNQKSWEANPWVWVVRFKKVLPA